MARKKRKLTKVNSFVIPSQETMAENIRQIYAQATEFDMRSGLNWYERTRQFIYHWGCEVFDYPLKNCVGAYAVISPSLTKETNDEQFKLCLIAHRTSLPLDFFKIGVYGRRNKEKAMRCLDGDLSAVGGDKVTRFYRNLLGIGDADVTVDRWALRVALGDHTIKDTQGLKTSQYKEVHDAYIQVSEEMGLVPHQVQAVTWEVLRNKQFRKSADTYK